MTDCWQDISTAPRDGSDIILCRYERVTVGNWMVPSETPRISYANGFAPEEIWDEFEPFWMTWDGGFTEDDPPLLWQPLPAGVNPPPQPGEPK